MRITYDATKRAVTLARRGLDFDDASLVFAGMHLTRRDERPLYDEDRLITLGVLRDEVVIIVWTERDATRRVISMRKADRHERHDFHRTMDRSR
ncbi:MAG: BrnT family toxin [Janthinobacterium lividum]